MAQNDVDPVAAATRPFSRFEWLLALRYLRAKRRDSFVSVIALFSFFGILIGVAALITVMSVMNGFRSNLLEKILGLGGHITLYASGSDFSDYESVSERIIEVDGVMFAAPMTEGQVLASYSNKARGIQVLGIRESDLDKLVAVSKNIKSGTLDQFDSSEGLAVGSRLADSLGIIIGDHVKLLSPNGISTPFGVAPRSEAFEVVAIFEVGMSEYDGLITFMPLAKAQEFLGTPGSVSSIDVFVDDPENVAELHPFLTEAADRQLVVRDWRSRNATLTTALEVERDVMFMILALIVLVAAMNIISGLIILVQGKGRDIAILRTMGASRGSVMRIFFITGASIGVSGTFAGFVIGIILALNVEPIRQFISWMTGTELFSPDLYFLYELPTEISSSETISIVVMSLVLSFLATLYPAWRAARLDPVEALRYE